MHIANHSLFPKPPGGGGIGWWWHWCMGPINSACSFNYNFVITVSQQGTETVKQNGLVNSKQHNTNSKKDKSGFFLKLPSHLFLLYTI